MFRFIKIALVCALFFASPAFAHGHHGHGGYGYGGYGYGGYGYRPYYGGINYAPAPMAGYYPVQQPYYAPMPQPMVMPYYGYGRQMPMYRHFR